MANPSDFLIVDDPKKPTTWHLQVRKDGKADHTLMGAAWAALHEGYRGNKYDGPGKSEALSKLKKLYASEKMKTPDGSKSGARHSASDQEMVQAIHDNAASLGADCTGAGKSAKAVPPGMDPAMYAMQEGWDVQDAAGALSSVSGLLIGETIEQDAEGVSQALAIARGLLTFIGSELDDLEQASGQAAETAGAGPHDSEPAGMGPINLATQSRTGKMGYSAAIGKTVNLDWSYVKSLRLPHDEQYYRDVLAAKFTGKDEIKHRIFIWGDPTITDVEAEFFTKSTDFWDAQLKGIVRPLTWDHGLDDTMKGGVVIGQTIEWGDDEIGRWAVSQLDRNHRYRKAIDHLINQGAVGTSSDSAPQYVTRERKGGATWLKQWPWFASALTTTPCEPRMLDASSLYWKAAGVAFTASARMGAGAGPDGPDADTLRALNLLNLNMEGI